MSALGTLKPAAPRAQARLMPLGVLEPPRLGRRMLIAVGFAVLVHVLLAALLLLRGPVVPVPPPDRLPPHTAEVEMIQDNAPNTGDQQVGNSKRVEEQAPPPPQTPPPPAPPRLDSPNLPVDAHGETPPPAATAAPQPDTRQPTAPPLPNAPPAPQTTPTPAAPQAGPQDSKDVPVIRLNAGDDGQVEAGGSADQPAAPDPTMPNLKPAYPTDAARRRESGAVDMMVHVAPDGSALAVIVAGSSGSRSLDNAATGAVKRWRFRPAVENGKRVDSYAPVELNFVLTK